MENPGYEEINVHPSHRGTKWTRKDLKKKKKEKKRNRKERSSSPDPFYLRKSADSLSPPRGNTPE